MEQIFKKDKLLNYSEIDHIKPIRIIIHNDISESIKKISDEDLEYNKLNENYDWIGNFLYSIFFKK
tara:strand:+ start:1004 stop:1201 length:198 start_codon:yes stop_codon:yes gene_type:complete